MQVSGLWNNDMFIAYYERQSNSDGKLARMLITAPHPHCKSLRATLFDEVSTVACMGASACTSLSVGMLFGRVQFAQEL